MVPSGTRSGVDEIEDAPSELVASTYEKVSHKNLTLHRLLRALDGVPCTPRIVIRVEFSFMRSFGTDLTF